MKNTTHYVEFVRFVRSVRPVSAGSLRDRKLAHERGTSSVADFWKLTG